MRLARAAAFATLVLGSAATRAAGIDGAALGATWGIPFAGMLLSIAILPLAAPKLWHHHFGKIALGWALLFLLPFLATSGAHATAAVLAHTLLAEYIPFIVLLTALFTVAGGIYIRGNLHGSPALNVGLLAIGALLGSVMGTTGASILMVRPLIRANDNRTSVAHVFVFFIFIVSNAGGALTPLGDPPLFLGFLKGVDFLWTLQAMLAPMLFIGGILLALFYVIDRHAWRRESPEIKGRSSVARQIRIEGSHNVLYLIAVAGTVLASGIWNRDVTIPIGLGIALPLNGLIRDATLIALSLLSWKTTKQSIRVENAFTWTPMQEVAILFAAIFITMIPMLAMLKAGSHGPFAPLLSLVSTPDGKPIDAAYFWLTGGLSSFLDNAPTYLVFFNLAGGDAQELMGPLASTLLAISAGAVFMGANTYIGNAPNFMVRSICEERGAKMPSFIGYMAWSGAILLPVFALFTWLWFL